MQTLSQYITMKCLECKNVIPPVVILRPRKPALTAGVTLCLVSVMKL